MLLGHSVRAQVSQSYLTTCSSFLSSPLKSGISGIRTKPCLGPCSTQAAVLADNGAALEKNGGPTVWSLLLILMTVY